MNTWRVLWIKEFRESWRSFKLLWIPLLFLFLGVSDPLVNYFMEDILNAVGNMPEGFQMIMPELHARDLLLATTEQFQMTGIIVLIAVFVGTISRERSGGTATLIYVRPVSAASIFLSKWMGASLVALLSALIGYIGSIYYTSVLYGEITFSTALTIIATYSVWLLLVMSLTVALSAAFTTAVAASLAIILIPIGGILDSFLGGYWHVTPWKLARYGVLVTDGTIESSYYWTTLLLVIGITLLCLVLGIWATDRNRRLAAI